MERSYSCSFHPEELNNLHSEDPEPISWAFVFLWLLIIRRSQILICQIVLNGKWHMSEKQVETYWNSVPSENWQQSIRLASAIATHPPGRWPSGMTSFGSPFVSVPLPVLTGHPPWHLGGGSGGQLVRLVRFKWIPMSGFFFVLLGMMGMNIVLHIVLMNTNPAVWAFQITSHLCHALTYLIIGKSHL